MQTGEDHMKNKVVFERWMVVIAEYNPTFYMDGLGSRTYMFKTYKQAENFVKDEANKKSKKKNTNIDNGYAYIECDALDDDGNEFIYSMAIHIVDCSVSADIIINDGE